MAHPSDLTEYAARLLLGTGLDLDQAALFAAGQHPASVPVAFALRDGWTAGDLDAESAAPAEGLAS